MIDINGVASLTVLVSIPSFTGVATCEGVFDFVAEYDAELVFAFALLV